MARTRGELEVDVWAGLFVRQGDVTRGLSAGFAKCLAIEVDAAAIGCVPDVMAQKFDTDAQAMRMLLK